MKVDDNCYDDDEYWCDYVPPMSPVYEDELVGDMRICGTRGGTPFV